MAWVWFVNSPVEKTSIPLHVSEKSSPVGCEHLQQAINYSRALLNDLFHNQNLTVAVG